MSSLDITLIFNVTYYAYLQVKWEVIKQTSYGGWVRQELSNNFYFKVLHLANENLSGNMGARNLKPPLTHETY